MLARRVRTLVGVVVVAVPLIGAGSYAFVRHLRVQQAELKAEEDRRAAEEDRRAAEAEANRKLEEAGKQRLATEQERQARAVAESEEAEQQRVAALSAAEEEGKRAEAEARTRYAALISQGNTDAKAGHYDRAIADYNEAIRLDSKSTLVHWSRRRLFEQRRPRPCPR
jgi:uncharacterized protein HemX